MVGRQVLALKILVRAQVSQQANQKGGDATFLICLLREKLTKRVN